MKFASVTREALIVYLAIIGLPLLIGVIIGYGLLGVGGSYYGISWSYKFPIGWAVAYGIILYILMIIGIIIFGYVFNMFASTFKSKQSLIQALKLTTYASTPIMLAGIFYIYPPISLLMLLFGIYSLYLLYIGIPIFMETPEEQRIIYLIISFVIFFVIIIVIYFVVNQIMWAVVGGYPTYTINVPQYNPPF